MKATMLFLVLLLAATPTVSAEPDREPDPEPVTISAATAARMSAAKWEQFGNTLVSALDSGHHGLQQGALRMIIQYGAYVDVKDGVFDAMRLYRDHEDDNVRRMAVVALGEMKSEWAVRFLERAIHFERVPSVQQTMRAVIQQHRVRAAVQ